MFPMPFGVRVRFHSGLNKNPSCPRVHCYPVKEKEYYVDLASFDDIRPLRCFLFFFPNIINLIGQMATHLLSLAKWDVEHG